MNAMHLPENIWPLRELKSIPTKQLHQILLSNLVQARFIKKFTAILETFDFSEFQVLNPKTVIAQTYTTPSTLDKYGKFLTLDRHVLRFFAIWDDREQLFGEARKFLIHFYMSDDTMEIKEVHEEGYPKVLIFRLILWIPFY